VAESLELAGPMVSRAAGFHDDARRWLRGEEFEKARAAEPTLGANSAGRGRDRDLENGLCEVDGDGCSLLHGLLLSVENNGSHDFGTRCRSSREEESISSLQGTRHAHLWLATLGAIVLARP